MWTCSKCSTRLSDDFDACWRCGTTAQGEAVPDFVTAEETEAIVDSTDFLRLKVGKLPDEELPGPPLELVDAFWSDSFADAKFVSDLLAAEGIRSTLEKAHYRGGVGGRVVVRSEDLPRASPIVEEFLERKRSRNK